jgi:hypothetical protein
MEQRFAARRTYYARANIRSANAENQSIEQDAAFS